MRNGGCAKGVALGLRLWDASRRPAWRSSALRARCVPWPLAAV